LPRWRVHYRFRCAFLGLTGLVVLGVPAACGDGTNKVAVRDSDGDEEIVTLIVTPPTVTKLVGETQRYVATASGSSGRELNVSSLVAWTSSDKAIATIDVKTGVATGRSPGTVVITATVSKVVATAELIVKPPGDPVSGVGGAAGAGGEAASDGASGAGGAAAGGTAGMGGAGEAGTTGGETGAAGASSTPVTRVYVSNLGGSGGGVASIRIFELTADGDATPVAWLAGPATTLKGPSQMAIAGDELFVAGGEGKSILVFDVNATGDVAPLRTIAGNATTFSNFSPMGLTLRGSTIFVSDQSKGLLTFPANGAGDIAPSAAIGPSFFYAAHVSNSPIANEVLVAVPSPASEVRGYLDNAGAAAAPLRVLKPGRAWARGVTSTPNGIFVVTAGLVGASVEDGVTVFAHDAATDAAPLRAIVGLTNTGFNDPHGISVYGGEIFVANQSEHAVRIFDEAADGDVAPLRVIKGAATGLSSPAGVLVATTGG
jgi:hypothetical protein